MESIQKTPVEVVQELLAVHTTRKEVMEKTMGNGAAAGLASRAQAAAAQSDAAIAALMAELSQFGDAVSASVNRENPYQETYKQSLDTLNAPDAAATGVAFQNLEEALHATYKDVIDAQTDLPQSLQELIQKQYRELG